VTVRLRIMGEDLVRVPAGTKGRSRGPGTTRFTGWRLLFFGSQ